MAINYEMNDDEATGFPSGTCGMPCGPNNNLDGFDDRIAVQVTAIF